MLTSRRNFKMISVFQQILTDTVESSNTAQKVEICFGSSVGDGESRTGSGTNAEQTTLLMYASWCFFLLANLWKIFKIILSCGYDPTVMFLSWQYRELPLVNFDQLLLNSTLSTGLIIEVKVLYFLYCEEYWWVICHTALQHSWFYRCLLCSSLATFPSGGQSF